MTGNTGFGARIRAKWPNFQVLNASYSQVANHMLGYSGTRRCAPSFHNSLNDRRPQICAIKEHILSSSLSQKTLPRIMGALILIIISPESQFWLWVSSKSSPHHGTICLFSLSANDLGGSQGTVSKLLSLIKPPAPLSAAFGLNL